MATWHHDSITVRKTKKWTRVRIVLMMSLRRYHSRLSGSRRYGMLLGISGIMKNQKRSCGLWPQMFLEECMAIRTIWESLETLLWTSPQLRITSNSASISISISGDMTSRSCLGTAESSTKRAVRYISLLWNWKISTLLNFVSMDWFRPGRTLGWLSELMISLDN